MAQNWKQSKCLSAELQINKLQYIHIMEYYSAIKRNKQLKYATGGISLIMVSKNSKKLKEVHTI